MKITATDIQRFSAWLTAEEKTPATIAKYVREARRFSTWLAGRDVLKPLTRSYKAELTEKRAPAGVNGAIAALNCLFHFLNLPECRLKSLKIQRPVFRDEDRELSQAEYRRLLSAAREARNERLLLTMETLCATGIRVSELKFFTAEAVRRGRADVANKGKVRTVFLPVKLQKRLLRYAAAQGITAGPIMITRSGKPLDRSNIWSDMKKLCRAAGVAEAKVFPHNLRHLFARTYYDLEKDIVRLADILGHASINTTRIYTMETGEVHRRQLEKMRLVI